MPNYRFTVTVQAHANKSPRDLGKAIARAITHATRTDIAGAETLDHRVAAVIVRPEKER